MHLRSFFLFALLLAVLNNALAQKFDQLMAAEFNSDGLGGVLLVAKGDKIIYQKAIGKGNMELNIPLSTDNVFRIGSITKQFTAVAILQLMEKGLLQLDDDITKFIPDYPVNGYHISVANLLSHTSGIKDMGDIQNLSPDLRRRKNSPADLVSLLRDQPFEFPPGTAFKYSNSNYILLGYIIERLSGLSYEQYIREHIFVPLGMTHAYYDSPEKIIPNRVTGYMQRQGDTVINAEYLDPTYAYAAGALVMTVEDLFKWHLGLYRYSILKKESLAKAVTPFVLNDGQKTKYGFGWDLDSLDGSAAIQHSGSINGFSAYEIYLPKENIFVACFSNRMNISTGQAATLAASIVANLPAVRDIQLSQEQMSRYIGTYKFKLDQPQSSSIYIKDNKLYSYQKGASHPWELHFISPTQFYFYEVFPNIHIFSFDSSGKVTGFVIHAPEYTSTITKIK